MAADLGAVLDRAAAVARRAARASTSTGSPTTRCRTRCSRCSACAARLDAAEARVLARWDAQRCWQPSGAKTGAAWLAWKQRVPIQVARQRLRHARALRTLPAVEEAWAAGEIDRAACHHAPRGPHRPHRRGLRRATARAAARLARTYGFVTSRRPATAGR